MPYRRNALAGCHLIAVDRKSTGMTFQKVHMTDTILVAKKTSRQDFRLRSDRTIRSIMPIRLLAGVNNRLKLNSKKSFRPRTRDKRKLSRSVNEYRINISRKYSGGTSFRKVSRGYSLNILPKRITLVPKKIYKNKVVEKTILSSVILFPTKYIIDCGIPREDK